ncbi:MAG TPA: thrombospondin type 3 repeat-containing protein [Polyangiaceae bacterium]
MSHPDSPSALLRTTLGVLGFAAALAVAPEARAASPELDLRRFQPPTHPEGLTSVEPTSTPGRGEWNLAGFFSYAYRAVEVPDGSGGEIVPVRHQLSADLVGGIGLGDRLGLGLSMPFILYQDGEPAPSGGDALPHSALGDLGVVARATLVPQGSLGGAGFAVLGRISFPTGNPSSYAAEGQITSELRLLFELGVLGSSLRAMAGARVRENERSFAGEAFGHDLPFGLGLVLKPQTFGWDKEGKWLWSLDAHGAVALTPSFAAPDQSPVLLALAARRAFGDAFGTIGVELPLGGGIGQPLVRAFVAAGIAPRVHDVDSDGIPDAKDICAELAEDRDGFEDGDGCPEFDNDGDGVPDGDDRCPRALEDVDDYADLDGCPDLDDDADGIPDQKDACPREPGLAANDPKHNGCPARDRDIDGIPEPGDRCPQKAEDRDGFQDDDGCPDLDDDEDGVPDREDTCPRVKGAARSDPALNGCPSPDRDGDTFDDALDRCPEAPETFDGVEDRDGCPDADAGKPPRPLAELRPARVPNGGRFQLELKGKIEFEADASGVRLSARSDAQVRAIAAVLNAHPEVVLMVAVRPLGRSAADEQQALTRSFALVDALRNLTHRDEVAETIGFAAVQRVKGALQPSGLGFLVLAPLAASAAPAGAKP